MINPEEALAKILEKIPFINVASHTARVEFSSHLAWSLAVVQGGYVAAGVPGFRVAAYLWLLWSFLREFIIDGHLIRIITFNETREDFADLLADLISRTACVIALWFIVQ